jgi:tetratricopeptide (TPR) repeat protein
MNSETTTQDLGRLWGVLRSQLAILSVQNIRITAGSAGFDVSQIPATSEAQSRMGSRAEVLPALSKLGCRARLAAQTAVGGQEVGKPYCSDLLREHWSELLTDFYEPPPEDTEECDWDQGAVVLHPIDDPPWRGWQFESEIEGFVRGHAASFVLEQLRWDEDDAIAVFEHDPFDPAERCAVLCYYYALWNNSQGRGWERMLLRAIRDLIDLRPIESLNDGEDIEWELESACLAGHWDRAGALCDWRRASGRDDEAAALRRTADIQFLRAVNRDGPMCRAAATLSISDNGQLATVIRAVTSLDLLGNLRQLSSQESRMLGECYRAKGIYLGTDGDVLALGARCFVSSAELQTAIDPESQATGDWERAVDCYERAGRLDDALGVVEAWERANPPSGMAYWHKGQLFARKGRYEEAFECSQKARELEVSPAASWELDLFLDLGRRFYDKERSAAFASELIKRSPALRETLDAAIGQHWPAFAKLDPEARSEWLGGVLMLSHPEMERLFGAARYGNAAVAIGRAVERELYIRVFAPVAAADEGRARLKTLGEMNAWLVGITTRYPDGWDKFAASHPSLYKCLQDKQRPLQRLADLRNKAAHHTRGEQTALVTPEELEEMRKIARRLLDALVPLAIR